jgi:hypothetical protein
MLYELRRCEIPRHNRVALSWASARGALYVTFPTEQFSSSDDALMPGHSYLFVNPAPAAKDGLFAVPARALP